MNNKKLMIITILISVICSVVISISIIANIMSRDELNIKDFKLSELNYTMEKLSYGINYDGEAKITCPNKNGTYLVIYSETLMSGGTYEKIGKTNYYTCIVTNGEGTITTYDLR